MTIQLLLVDILYDSGIHEFVDAIDRYAIRLHLNSWDYCAIIISIISLCVATWTLKSQRQTQLNTQPDINKPIQRSLLSYNLVSIFDSYVMVFALHYILYKTKYNTKPSPQFWNYVIPNTGSLHEELFYSNVNEFVAFHDLVEIQKTFIWELSSLREVVESQCSQEKKRNEILHIYENIGLLIYGFKEALSKSLKMKDSDIYKMLKDNFFNVQHSRFEDILRKKYFPTDRISKPYCRESNVNSFLQPHYERFTELSTYSSGLVSIDKKKFIVLLSRYVDCVVTNVRYKDQIMPVYSLSDENKQQLQFFKTNCDHTQTLLTKKINPLEDISTGNWLFYMEDFAPKDSGMK
ncbi:hypothetical protein [Bacteroides sp.]|uniref:hypothetical protein n=1 Tax=Bacteroides sp. TaxID=29523 RepID=UPI003A8F3A21